MAEPSATPEEQQGQGQSDAIQRDRDADDREAALDAREAEIQAREASLASRSEEAQAILDQAEARDGQADARDTVADDRDHAASLESFLHDHDPAAGIAARRDAGLDRSSSKDDRTFAADDRHKLTVESGPPSQGEGSEDVAN